MWLALRPPSQGGGDSLMSAQIAAVGTTPTIPELFVGSLMQGTVSDARSVLRFVEDTDVDEPAATVLMAVRAVALRGTPPSPQLIHDELKRRGRFTRSTGVWLTSAVTSGACSSAAPAYAGALVSESLRSNVESFGHAMTSMSATASEADIVAVVERAAAGIRGIAARLTELRGESL
ncbi:hypothetical protein EAH80_04370 [Mycobacterium hodleri]|uniref:Uncharacterized protein n=1 Tax=Mycolicibacterium hodleri TaxID=49897 RepID=A0A502EKP7_9MYCO|nr:hypothetical protein EAH80_04370 [Mycolicibacterium hodleri]